MTLNQYHLLWRHLALWSYLSLVAWLLTWNAWLAPSTQYPVAIVLIILLAPLMFALRGILHARRYTHAWLSMLTMFYFLLGVMDAYADPSKRIYGMGVLLLSLLLFAGCICFVRSSRQQQA